MSNNYDNDDEIMLMKWSFKLIVQYISGTLSNFTRVI